MPLFPTAHAQIWSTPRGQHNAHAHTPVLGKGRQQRSKFTEVCNVLATSGNEAKCACVMSFNLGTQTFSPPEDPCKYGVPFVSKLLFNRCLAETSIFSKGIDV